MIVEIEKELVPTLTYEINGSEQVCVDASELHLALEVKSQFDKWIDRRVVEYGFEEGVDFVKVLETRELGRPYTRYVLSIDMGKELGMVERTAKGKEIRKYFIRIEAYLREMHEAGWVQKYEEYKKEYKERLHTATQIHVDHKLESRHHDAVKLANQYDKRETAALSLLFYVKPHIESCTCKDGKWARDNWKRIINDRDVSSMFVGQYSSDLEEILKIMDELEAEQNA